MHVHTYTYVLVCVYVINMYISTLCIIMHIYMNIHTYIHTLRTYMHILNVWFFIKLSGLSHKESGGSDEDDWEQVASDTRQTISQLQTLSKDFMMLQQKEKYSKEKKREDEEQEKKPENLSSKKMETISSTILPSIHELDEFERLQKYLSWVKRTQFLRWVSVNHHFCISLFHLLSSLLSSPTYSIFSSVNYQISVFE